MDADVRTVAILMAVGLIPFALAGGFAAAGETSVVPWALGFGAQAAFVASVLAWRRLRSRKRRATAQRWP